MGTVEFTKEHERRESVRKALGEALKKARAERGLSQKELAERTGITSTYLSQIETGERLPSFGLLTKLASELDMRASQLMSEAEFPKQGGEMPLLHSLVKVVELAPDVEKLHEVLVSLEASQVLDRTRAAWFEAERAVLAELATLERGKELNSEAVEKVLKKVFRKADEKVLKKVFRKADKVVKAKTRYA